jgi:hypothetical protein
MYVFRGADGVRDGVWVVESELDAIMLTQHVRTVIALRSATNPIDQFAKAALLSNSPIISCPDNDWAGYDGNLVFIWYCEDQIKRRVVTCRVVEPHKDVGDFVMAGGNLEEFVNMAYQKAELKGLL